MSKAKPHRVPIEPFRWDPGHPLAPGYELAASFISENTSSGWNYTHDVAFELHESGRKMKEADLAKSARLVVALVDHAYYFDKLGEKVKALAANEMERTNWHFSPEWEAVWFPRQIAAKTLRLLMRRKLPFQAEHLIRLADWIADAEWQSDFHYPLKAFVKAVESYGRVPAEETVLRESLARVARAFCNSQDKELPKLAQKIETLLGGAAQSEFTEYEELGTPKAIGPDPSKPAPVGSSSVLLQLKQFLGTSTEVAESASEEIGFDHFPLRSDSPLREEHEVISILLSQVVEGPSYHSPVLNQFEAGREMLQRDDTARGRLVLALAERCTNTHFVPGGGLADHRCWQSQYAVQAVFSSLLRTTPKFDRDGLFDILLYLSALHSHYWIARADAVGGLISQVESFATESPFTSGERHVLHRLRCRSVRSCPFGRPSEDVQRLNHLLGDNAFLALVPGEAWTDAVNSRLASLPRPARDKWIALLEHAFTANSSNPSAKWLKTAQGLQDAIGGNAVSAMLQEWFSLVNAPRTTLLLVGEFMMREGEGTMHDDNATCLRGLVWMSSGINSPEMIRNLGALTLSCYRKVPGVGPRAVKVGNAGVYALSQIDDPAAMGQLALLKVRVKFNTAQKLVEKAFETTAARVGIPREELEEMAVPAYGLTEVGRSKEQFGDFTAELNVEGSDSTSISWIKSDGKRVQSVPAVVKEKFAADWKEFQGTTKDIQRMLPAQRERIDSLFREEKTWPVEKWRERYLDHPLVGVLARRLIWEFTTDGRTTAAGFFNGAMVDLDLKPLPKFAEDTTVRLWHPIGKDAAEVVAWREWLEAQQIQQPFKQAHREVYLLTDAERHTRTYSNRFAAHVIKQHQFNALCAARGWKNKLRLLVDAEYPPATVYLPRWNLRAEFWIEGIGNDYGTDTNDSGTFLRLSTDQVRFYRMEAAQRAAHAGGGGYYPPREGDDPLPLEEIPPLVFSEVMRDVDLFVGVASVGNDPTWQDGGPDGRYRQYWHNYSFGDLSETANTRKEVLQRLVPKLKIAAQCSFNDKFLVVKGTLRTYKIHLGSGNILMEPNDQYLCIVPKQGGVEEGKVLLPFEGDRTLSVIISKAFLLAEDTKIKDETILRQIR